MNKLFKIVTASLCLAGLIGCSVSNTNKVEASIEKGFYVKYCESVTGISNIDFCELVHKETGVVYLLTKYYGTSKGGVSITPMYDKDGNILSE